MAVRAVIFDWGGTLTPWHSIDLGELWLAVCARHYPAERGGGDGRGGPRRRDGAVAARRAVASELRRWTTSSSGPGSPRRPTSWPATSRRGTRTRSPTRTRCRCCASCGGAASRWACSPTRCGRAARTSRSSSGTRSWSSSTARSTPAKSTGSSRTRRPSARPWRRSARPTRVVRVRRRPALRRHPRGQERGHARRAHHELRRPRVRGRRAGRGHHRLADCSATSTAGPERNSSGKALADGVLPALTFGE